METVSEWLTYAWLNERWTLLPEASEPQQFLDHGWLVWSVNFRKRGVFAYDMIDIVLWQPLPPPAWRRLFCLAKA
jgi:hypothetical protein